MSSEKKGRGIVDPWRKVEPLRAPSRPPTVERERIDLDAVDHDADLAIPGSYTIRSKHTSFHITSTRITAPAAALEVFVDCLAALFLNKTVGGALIDGGIGVRYRDRAWNVPSEETAASVLKGGDAVIWFIENPLDLGMLALAKILRTPDARATLRRFGVLVMMTAS